MTLHREHVIDTGPDTRLVVGRFENGRGEQYVSVAAQYRDHRGEWRLTQSGLLLTPEVARKLAPALVATSAAVDAAPVDPMPTEQDRDESRMP